MSGNGRSVGCSDISSGEGEYVCLNAQGPSELEGGLRYRGSEDRARRAAGGGRAAGGNRSLGGGWGGGDRGAYLSADEKGPLEVLERGDGHENQVLEESLCQWCCPLYTDEC